MVAANQSNLPDYEQLVKFLFQPFLSATEPIGIDCEYTLDRHRVWIRVAVASSDQGSAFGRGGRNIQAIRTVLQAAATAVGQSIHLDVYGSNSSSRDRDADRTSRDEDSANPARSTGSRPTRSAPNRRPANGEDRPSSGDSPSVPPPRPRR
jgi:uncharacterized protein